MNCWPNQKSDLALCLENLEKEIIIVILSDWSKALVHIPGLETDQILLYLAICELEAVDNISIKKQEKWVRKCA